jgi:hypothetical protein
MWRGAVNQPVLINVSTRLAGTTTMPENGFQAN